MEDIHLIISIICFLGSAWWVVARINGVGATGVFLIKLVSLTGIILPIIYWMTLAGILKT